LLILFIHFYPHSLQARLDSRAKRAGKTGMSVLRFIRLWYPILSYTFFYQELEILNSFFTGGSFDEAIIALEASVFRGQPSLWLSEVFKFSLLSEYLHLSYFSYYFLIPSLGFTLYFKKRWKEFRLFVFSLTTGFFFCFIIFIFYPVHGPFYQFEMIGPPLSQYPFYKLIHFIIDRWDSSGTAFPSSHVAVALLVLLWARQYERRVFRILAPFVTGLIVGTVYCRVHYAVDALAGILVGIFIYIISPYIYSFLSRKRLIDS
jgi:membrane-associated phospholipid phosphatase